MSELKFARVNMKRAHTYIRVITLMLHHLITPSYYQTSEIVWKIINMYTSLIFHLHVYLIHIIYRLKLQVIKKLLCLIFQWNFNKIMKI